MMRSCEETKKIMIKSSKSNQNEFSGLFWHGRITDSALRPNWFGCIWAQLVQLIYFVNIRDLFLKHKFTLIYYSSIFFFRLKTKTEIKTNKKKYPNSLCVIWQDKWLKKFPELWNFSVKIKNPPRKKTHLRLDEMCIFYWKSTKSNRIESYWIEMKDDIRSFVHAKRKAWAQRCYLKQYSLSGGDKFSVVATYIYID